MNLMDVFIKIGIDSGDAEKGIDRVQGKVKGFGGLGAAVFGAWEQVGMRVVNTVFSSISSNLDGAINRFDTLRNYTNVMVNLGYGATEAEESINTLKNSIDHLPTTLDKVVAQTQSFAPLADSLDEATNITLAWSNAMAAGGQSVEQQSSAIDAWTRAMSKGKVEMNEWEIITRTAPGQVTQLSKALLGETATYGDLKKALDDGTVSLDDVNKAMIAMTGTVDEETGQIQESVKINGQTFATFAKQAQDASAGIQMATFNVKAAIQRNIEGVLGGLNERLSSFGGISGMISGLIPAINAVGDRLKSLASGNMSIGEFLTFDTSGLIAKIDEGLPALIDKGLELAEGFTTSLREGFGNLVSSGLEIVEHIAQGIADSMPSLVEKVPTIISNIAGLINDNAPKLIETGFHVISSLVQGIIQAVPTIIANLPKILKAIWDVFTAFNWLALGRQVVTAIGNGLKAAGTKLPGAMRSIGKKAWNAIKNINWRSVGRTIISLLKGGITGAGRLAVNALKSVGTKAMKAFKNINWSSVGRAIVNGIVSGIKAAGGKIITVLVSLGKQALSKVKSLLGIHSPSKVFRDEVGKNIALGMAAGIEDGVPNVMSAIGDMNDAIDGMTYSFASPIPLDGYATSNSFIQEELSVEFANQIAELGEQIKAGMVDAVEGLTITLDKRAFGKATRKAMA